MEKTESLIKKIKLFRKRIEDVGDYLLHEGLGVNPRTRIIKQGVKTHGCDLSTRKVEADKLLSLTS